MRMDTLLDLSDGLSPCPWGKEERSLAASWTLTVDSCSGRACDSLAVGCQQVSCHPGISPGSRSHLQRQGQQTERSTSFLRGHAEQRTGVSLHDIDGPRRTSRTACSTDGWIVSPVRVRGLRVGSAESPPHEGAYLNSSACAAEVKFDSRRLTLSHYASFMFFWPWTPSVRSGRMLAFAGRSGLSDQCRASIPPGKWHTAPPLSTEETDSKGTCAILPLCQPPKKVAHSWRVPFPCHSRKENDGGVATARVILYNPNFPPFPGCVVVRAPAR
jgi:hypothetical protein